MRVPEHQKAAVKRHPPLAFPDRRYVTTVRRFLVVLRLWVRHGRYAELILWGLLGPPFYVITRIMMWLDTVIYPNLRRVEISRPVFIIGHPRSGTTFLQKHLFEVDDVSMFRAWELFFPSLLQKKLARPLFVFLRRLGLRQFFGAETGHEVVIDAVEEDEAILLHRMDTETLHYLCPWLMTDDDLADYGFRLGWLSPRITRRTIRFYHECLKRQLLHTGHGHVVAKSTSLVFRLRELLDEFPDARIIYMWRDPKDSILSYLTLHDRHVGRLLTRSQADTYFRRKYEWGVALYESFEEAKELIPAEQLLVVPFRQMVASPEETIRLAAEFGKLHEAGADLNLKVRRRQKKHRNASFNRFGLRAEKVEADLDTLKRRHARRLREHQAQILRYNEETEEKHEEGRGTGEPAT